MIFKCKIYIKTDILCSRKEKKNEIKTFLLMLYSDLTKNSHFV